VIAGLKPAGGLKSIPPWDGRSCGWCEDNAWAISLLDEALMQFNKLIVKYPSIARFPGGASTDLLHNLQNPENPLPLLGDLDKVPRTVGAH
jgi:hypothetical protein